MIQKPIPLTLIPFATFSLFHTLTFVRSLLPKPPASAKKTDKPSPAGQKPPTQVGGLGVEANKKLQVHTNIEIIRARLSWKNRSGLNRITKVLCCSSRTLRRLLSWVVSSWEVSRGSISYYLLMIRSILNRSLLQLSQFTHHATLLCTLSSITILLLPTDASSLRLHLWPDR